MEKEYNELKEFWNNNFKDLEIEKIDSKWIDNKDFNEVIKENINEDSTILDYGCGTGWAIFEVFNTLKFNKGIGVDTSINGIEYCNKIKELSNMNNLEFYNSDESILDNYKDTFDFVMSFNTLDVVPDEIIDSILEKMNYSMKKGSKAFIGLNHDFSIEELTDLLKMERKGKYFFKDGILRCNKKRILEWEITFSKYFKVIDAFEFYLTENEKKYPRMGYILVKE